MHAGGAEQASGPAPRAIAIARRLSSTLAPVTHHLLHPGRERPIDDRRAVAVEAVVGEVGADVDQRLGRSSGGLVCIPEV